MNKIEYTVELLTPAITAKNGTIGKEIDVKIKRDINGNSYYSAKHIKGILRSKILEFKNALDEDGEKFTNKYFGSSGINISKLRFSNLILEKNVEEETGYRYGVKINRKTKVAEDNSLFSYEFVKPKNIYKGFIEFENIESEDLKFILASLFHVDKIGGLKSRGLGKVEVKIEGKSIEKLDELVKKYSKKENEYTLKNNNYEEYEYELKFLEPIVLQGRCKKNEIEVRSSLQGSTIRGALIQSGLDKGIGIEKLLDISVEKVAQFEKEKEIINLASNFKTKYKINEKYVKIDKVIDYIDEYKGIKLERGSTNLLNANGSEISIKIDEKTRTTEESMLFNSEYVELSKDDKTVFKGVVKVPSELFKVGKEYDLKIGKFKSKGFGKTTIKFSKLVKKNITKEIIKEKIEKLNKQIEKTKKDQRITVTLDFMSDMVLPMNQVKNVGEEIKSLFLSETNKLELDAKRTFVNVEKLRGYNIINNVRKCDEIVITRGSVITYFVNDELENVLDKFVEIEKNGLGLRKNEGFGKIEICSKAHLLEDKN